MFYPEHRKNFKFYISSDWSDERIKLDIDELSKMMNNYELPLRNSNVYKYERSFIDSAEYRDEPRRDRENSKHFKKRRDNNPNIMGPESRDSKKSSLLAGKLQGGENKDKRLNFSIQIIRRSVLWFKCVLFVFICPDKVHHAPRLLANGDAIESDCIFEVIL